MVKREKYVLGIDTSEAETGIGLAGARVHEIKTWISKRNQSQELLPKIDALLRKHHIKPRQLKWVAVNLGPGSFTGLRVGISLANAFGYGLGIPVIGEKELVGSARERVERLLKLTTKSKTFRQVLPHYGRPPRITKSKNK